MFIPKCLFCDHTNPADAKYCNECGSPLHLQLCKQCEAINDAAAKICHKCGTAIAALVITPDAAALTRVAEGIAAVTAGYADHEREHSALSQTIAESQVVRVRRPATPSDTDSDVEAVAIAPRSHDPYGRSPACETLDATRGVASQLPGTTALRRRKFRVAMAALFSTVLLGAVAVLAYNAYRHPVQVGEQVSTPSTAPQPIEVEASVEASGKTPVEIQPEPAGASESKPTDAKSTKPVKSVRDRQRTRTEPVAVPSAQVPTTPAAQAPEPDSVPSTVAPPPDPPPSLDQQLARCAYGSVFERVLCDQRVRIAYCEGRWGRVPECPSGRVADYGQ